MSFRFLMRSLWTVLRTEASQQLLHIQQTFAAVEAQLEVLQSRGQCQGHTPQVPAAVQPQRELLNCDSIKI